MAFPNDVQCAVLRVLAAADGWVRGSNRTVSGDRPTVSARTADALVNRNFGSPRQLVEARHTAAGSLYRITDAGRAKLA